MHNTSLVKQRRVQIMLSPLIPDIKHPKWNVVVKLLELIALPRAHKIAGRLKISDVNNFLTSIKVLILADLSEELFRSLSQSWACMHAWLHAQPRKEWMEWFFFGACLLRLAPSAFLGTKNTYDCRSPMWMRCLKKAPGKRGDVKDCEWNRIVPALWFDSR